MSRQKKRSTERAIVKSITKKLNPPKAKIAVSSATGLITGAMSIAFHDLSDRQKNGLLLYERSQAQNSMCIAFTPNESLWCSQNDSTRTYRVENEIRNLRGKVETAYRCQCQDFITQGGHDCKHIFAEKLRRGEVTITDTPTKKKRSHPGARRGPARKRKDYKGRSIRTSQKEARVDSASRMPNLITSMGRAFQMHSSGIIIPLRPQKSAGGRRATSAVTRAMALLHKIVLGKSADAMIHEYERLIESGTLHLEKPPHQNTLTEWMNDERLTPILHEFLRITSLPFRAREVAAIIDSSKVSQLRNAHYQSVEYEGDERPEADWMKCHALVGVETMVVMAVAFSGSVNPGTHDINFVPPLMTEALKTFPLEFMLGDKAYLKEDILAWLWDRGIKAVIPVKKRWFRDEKKAYHESVMQLVKWFDEDNGRIFQQFYRLRPKIEAFFSLLKRSNQEHCWSRGRRSNTARNAETPCTAWINETLCKFIYMNLRTTHTLEKETGYKIDYSLPDRHFGPPSEPLILRAA